MFRVPSSFYAGSKHMKHKNSLVMNRKLKKNIREALFGISRQSGYEVVHTLASLEDELGLIVSNFFVMPPSSDGVVAIPLDYIYVAFVTDTHVFMLCHNGLIHCVERSTRNYEVIFPAYENPDFWNMFIKACEDYKERLRRQTLRRRRRRF